MFKSHLMSTDPLPKLKGRGSIAFGFDLPFDLLPAAHAHEYEHILPFPSPGPASLVTRISKLSSSKG